MKYILFIALLCASFVSFSQTIPSDTRVVKKCNYSNEQSAHDYGVLESVFRTSDEEVQSLTTSYNSNTGKWCYTLTFVCTQPLNKEQVPVEAKLVKIQGCRTKE